ncbi:MAG: hypothetical protein Q9166_000704 [cf. Caloplaca sp. 2 TL-2023]
MDVDLLKASASDFQALLSSKKPTSVDLVFRYYDQIVRHNCEGPTLHAIITTSPQGVALARAQELDAERRDRGPRGPLRGIPTIVNDTFNMDPSMKMSTSCGAVALKDSHPKRNAARSEMSSALQKFEEAGARVVQPVDLNTVPKPDERSPTDINSLILAEYKENFEQYLSTLDGVPVQTVQQLVDHNKEYAESCLPPGEQSEARSTILNNIPEHPSQAQLEDLPDKRPDSYYQTKRDEYRSIARDALEEQLNKHDLDVILGPGDGRIASVSAAAGSPVGVMPLGYANFNGRAFGMNVIARPNDEGEILEVMSAWRSAFPNARMPPPMLVHEADCQESSRI